MKISPALNALHKGQSLAVSIFPSAPSLLAWIGVYPLDLSRETTRELLRNHGQAVPLSSVQVYRIRRFEVERALIERDASIAEPELKNKSNCFVYGDEGLEEKLQEFGIKIEQLALPYKSNYPI